MSPRLTIGLPVYNGEEYLAQSLDALLDQTYPDFHLLISDNASTDRTAEICHDYAARDRRIRYVRQPVNIGAAPNHNFVFAQARTEYFKWASHDDLYHRDLLARCIDALDTRPEMILSHAHLAIIDGQGEISRRYEYTMATDSDSPSERFRSLLFGYGGDDFYGVIRSESLRRVTPHDSYHHADRTFVAEIALHGPFHQVPEVLYFRRDHPTRAERACTSVRSRCANLDPRRADPLRHPVFRLYADYVRGYLAAIRRAPISAAERRECYRDLARWFTARTRTGHGHRFDPQPFRAGVGSALEHNGP